MHSVSSEVNGHTGFLTPGVRLCTQFCHALVFYTTTIPLRHSNHEKIVTSKMESQRYHGNSKLVP